MRQKHKANTGSAEGHRPRSGQGASSPQTAQRQRTILRLWRTGPMARTPGHGSHPGQALSPYDPGQDRTLAPVTQEPDPAYLTGELENRIGQFATHYNTRRYHESLNNLTPEDVYLGRGQAILTEREKIKRHFEI